MLNTSITHDSLFHTHPHTKNISSYLSFPPSMPTYFFIQNMHISNINLAKSLIPASHTSCNYLNSTHLPTVYKYVYNLTLVLNSSSKFLLSYSLIHFSAYAIHEADELSPCLISSNHSFIYILNTENIHHPIPHFPLPSSMWFNIPLLIKQLLRVPIFKQYS